ncbi:MAG: type II toxin-antitoxin system HicB family antitoxin [Synergistales bacterium]|nr:type II toxin-antitoxin system HicB family antitoxin [Synergistales bacterium]
MKESYTYPAIFEFYDDGGIGVFFPDLPGCVSCGDDEEDAIEMAKEALGGHLFCMIEDSDPIPTASKIRDINLEKDQTSVLITTWMPIIREKVMQSSVKKTLTIPFWLDKIAKEKGVNYSHILQAGLKRHLGIDEKTP